MNETEEEKQTKNTSAKVTYISYSNPKFKYTVLTNYVIFIGRLDISYDYALDYDINYNEGNEGCMSLSDCLFSKDLGGSNSGRAIYFTPR